MKFTASSCCLLVSSLLLLTGAQATFNHHDKIDKNNGEEPLENEARTFREARHSPFHVHNSKELNRALAILEHESQTSHWHRGEDERWWADEGRNGGRKDKHGDDKDATARGQGKHHKKDERDFFFGRILIEKAGDYYLDRDFIFSDGFKLEITGTHEKLNHGKHHHAKHSDDGYHQEGHRHGKTEQKDVVIHAAPNQRHFTFDDHAILKACDLTFVDGGCEKEGFYGGSMLFVNRATGKFEDVHWHGNTAWVGGAVYAENARCLSFHRGSFEHNKADRKGGAVAIEEERGQTKKKHHGHNNNEDKRTLYHDDGDNGDSSFGSRSNDDDNNNHHKNKKRGRRVTRVSFRHVLFSRNRADLGGALFNAGSHTDIEDSRFEFNRARLGGALYVNHHGRLLIRESAFYRNETSAKGGAIFSSGRVWIVCSRFAENQAPLGCDIWNNGTLKCTASTEHVKVDGSGEGYCHACVQPSTAGPTMESTPTRRVKKPEDKGKKDHHDKGLFGLFGDKHEKEDGYVYDYYGNGDATAFDRWNGDYNAWDAEEADAHKDHVHSHGENQSYN